ncbi:ribulose-1,5-biphosphate synthetase [Sphingobacterium spiritivorum]|uniref:Ribulose-1,5-biphosphate synthetase n=1 Tax=Sphingobacterium spiritivorum TaxID=258 RepID=A0A380CMX7_SPHSI|nr:NAD(P)/FAD-dependent oxidoreductase [Sphingobacterium spiritivorum]SUJ24443.1 ribulose-1,5-biphosphate synthetase [Sphingobacterium spiritivorum]
MKKTQYDAVIVGAGPNGLAAAITLQQQGLSVLLIEGKDTVGGGMRTLELTLPGYAHDVCSAIHPMALGSPFFATLPLADFGLEFIHAPFAAAHPFDDGSAACLSRSLTDTAQALGNDAERYRSLIGPFVDHWEALASDSMGPLRFPKNPLLMANFGRYALQPADLLVSRFQNSKTRALWAGMAAHAIQPLHNLASSAVGLMLLAVGHRKGWPIPKGGSQAIADALATYFVSLGGEIRTGIWIEDLDDLPPHKVALFDVTPRQLDKIAGNRLKKSYSNQLKKYRYGMGVFKMDWALDGPVPFRSADARSAGTVHLGNTFEEIAEGEWKTSKGQHVETPFVLLAQQSLFDTGRVPEGKQAVWAYCHVPNGSTQDMSRQIENQIERFAPGFKDRILARNTMDTQAMETYNPNYIGGDINGGIIDIRQLYTRPVLSLSPYRTSLKQVYICSSSTPPGGGVHGMCGYHAARLALQDVFDIRIPRL